MSYVSQPPRYDTRRQPNGEPPGYLDTSQRDFPHDSERGYILDERGYPLNDRSGGSYAADREFQPMDQHGFSQEFPEHSRGYGISRGGPDDRQIGGDLSYDLQAMMMLPGQAAGEFRDGGYDQRTTELPSVHVRNNADRAYATDPRDANDRGFADHYYDDATQRYYVSNVLFLVLTYLLPLITSSGRQYISVSMSVSLSVLFLCILKLIRQGAVPVCLLSNYSMWHMLKLTQSEISTDAASGNVAARGTRADAGFFAGCDVFTA